ncbi:MAG: carbohydrate kinase family protein, partial [Eubacteriales bacterium]
SRMNFDALYFGTLIQRLASSEAIRLILENCFFYEVFCDINLRRDCYSRAGVETCFANATVLKISAEEEPLVREMEFYEPPPVGAGYYEAVSKELCRRYPLIKVVIFTMGENGSFAYEKATGKSYFAPAVPCRVVSTVGAGDSYSAAWFTAWYGGKTIPDAMRAASVLSSFVTAHKDAVP